MKRLLLNMLAVFSLGSVSQGPAIAQTIVNDYTRVLSVETINCVSRIVVDSLASFRIGDEVLIIQTGGCTVSAGYDVEAVGRCEFANIATIRGTTIELTFPLLNTYASCGVIQLVRVPVTFNSTITAPVTGRAWDGRVGGVVVIDNRGTLTLRAGISADGLGFRGGVTWQGGGDCSQMVDDDVAGSTLGAAKGETYVRPLPSMVAGGRALYNGGGGGRGHNSGGGGGGNGGVGGRGGSQWQGCGSFFDNGGRPGSIVAVQSGGRPTLVMGGGGGAGHMNNNSGTAGARGGGIVIIRTDTIVGNQNVISANGLAPALVGGNDGAGGGGAGGTVHLEVSAAVGPVAIVARGGNGGNINNGGLHGPGGAGGGGTLSISQSAPPASVTFDLSGGVSGRNVAFTDPRNSDYLAEGGKAGTLGVRAVVPHNQTRPVIPNVRALNDYVVCQNDSLVLDCVVGERADSVRWFDSRQRVLGGDTRLGFRAVRTDTFVVRAYGTLGCFSADTLIVTVRPQWNVTVDLLDLGTIRCDRTIDTSVVIRNRGALTARLRALTDSASAARWTSALPDSLAGGGIALARIRLVPGPRKGADTALLKIGLSPCDSMIIGRVIWRREDRVIDIRPDTVVMPMLETCTTRSSSVDVDLVFEGADVIVEKILTDAVASAALVTPFAAADRRRIKTRITWTPTRSSATGRIGFIVRDSACLDTLWTTVYGPVKAPFLIAPVNVQADTMVLCRDSLVRVPIAVVADTATPWVLDSIATTGPGIVVNPVGDTLRGSDTIVVHARPTAPGPYEIIARIRLVPCDTVVVIRIRGTAIDAAIQSTPRIDYTERFIGRRQVLQATCTNSGTSAATIRVASLPSAPFRVLRITPPPPVRLLPGESIVIDAEYLQTFGVFTDSIVLERVDPCPTRILTMLRGEGAAITRVRIPDVNVATGKTVDVPVLLDGLPDIDTSLLDSFEIRFAWKSTEASAADGSSLSNTWRVERSGDSSRISILGAWNGTDTLAVVPVLSLLSVAESTVLVFDKSIGFRWLGQSSDVLYDDGLLVIDEVCAGRRLRNVALGSTRPLIQPVPVQDVMHVILPGNAAGSITIVISDMLGQTVLQHAATVHRSDHQHRLDVNVTGIASGTYIVHIETPDGSADIPAIIR